MGEKVGLAPEISGQQTDQTTDNGAEHGRDEPDDQRDPRAVDNPAVDVPPEMIAPEPVPGARGLERVGRIRLDRIIGGERSREDGTERHDEHQRPADGAERFPPAEPSERAPRRQAGDGTRDRDRCRTRVGGADAPTWHIGYAGRARRRGGRPRGW